MKADLTVYLPYYVVRVGDARFYGEAGVTPLLPPVKRFLLALPRDPGFEKIPSLVSARRIAPPGPSDYAELVEEALDVIRVEASRPGPEFDFGGLRGLLKAILGSLSPTRRSSVVRATGKLEARLALYYVEKVLGVSPGDSVRVDDSPLWLRVRLRVSEGAVIGAWDPAGARMRVLERLASEEARVRSALLEG